MKNYLIMLRNEFEAGEGSFLIQLRPGLTWDKTSFTRLARAMQKCCQQYGEAVTLDRWMANGFWYLPMFVREWTTHDSFPRSHSAAYFEKAYKRLDDLAYWFFFGESPYLDGTDFEPL